MCVYWLIGISLVFPHTHSHPRPPESPRQMLCACTSNVCYEYEPLTNIHGWFCSSSLPWPSSPRIPLVMQSVSVVRRWLGDTIRLWRCWISTVLACPHQPSQVYVICQCLCMGVILEKTLRLLDLIQSYIVLWYLVTLSWGRRVCQP